MTQQALLDLQNKFAASQTAMGDLTAKVNTEIATSAQSRAQNAALRGVVNSLVVTAAALKTEIDKLIAAAGGTAPALGADDLAVIQQTSQQLDTQIQQAQQAAAALSDDTAAIQQDIAAQSAEADTASQANQLDSPTN